MVAFAVSISSSNTHAGMVAEAPPPRLLDQVHAHSRLRHFSRRTEKAYTGWIRRFILYHGKRHPSAMGATEVTAFLSDLARVLRNVHGVEGLVISLLYGCGLRLLEGCRLRVEDLDLDRREIVVRDGKGRRDRITLLPDALLPELRANLERVRALHEADLVQGKGSVELPDAIERKYPHAPWEWGWQWVFPATRFYFHRETGRRRRHHLHESVVQRAMRRAVLTAGLTKPAGCHTLRHHADFRIMPSRRSTRRRFLGVRAL